MRVLTIAVGDVRGRMRETPTTETSAAKTKTNPPAKTSARRAFGKSAGSTCRFSMLFQARVNAPFKIARVDRLTKNPTGAERSRRPRFRNPLDAFARQIFGARARARVRGQADRRLFQLLPGDRPAGCAGRAFPASDRERRGRAERYVPHSVYPVLRLNAHCAGVII